MLPSESKHLEIDYANTALKHFIEALLGLETAK